MKVVGLKIKFDRSCKRVYPLRTRNRYCLSLKFKMEVSKKALFAPNKFSQVSRWNVLYVCSGQYLVELWHNTKHEKNDKKC